MTVIIMRMQTEQLVHDQEFVYLTAIVLLNICESFFSRESINLEAGINFHRSRIEITNIRYEFLVS